MLKPNWKTTLNNKLMAVMRSEGPAKFLEAAIALLNVSEKSMDKALLVGQVCECVLVGLTTEYIRLKNYEASMFNSVVLKDLRDTKSDFRTELDGTLVTPYFILTIECKSFKGNMEIRDKCTIHRSNGKDADLWAQSKLHHEHLYRYAERLALPNKGMSSLPVFACAFLFSDGAIVDKRLPAEKSSLRVLTSSTLLEYYEAMFNKYKKPVFDYTRACNVFDKCARSKTLHTQHGKYLGYGVK